MTDDTMTPAEELRQAAQQIDSLASSGQMVAVDPEVADFMGSFDEEALAEAEAHASTLHVDAETLIVIPDDEEEAWQ